VTFDQAQIREQVAYSYYDYNALDSLYFSNGRHPFDGLTNPDLGTATGYSWIKAPRYGTATPNNVCEVGPLARIAVSYMSPDTSLSVTSLNAIPLVLPGGGSYNVRGLVTNVVTNVLAGNAAKLVSALGRHAARACEAKLLADACAVWSAAIAANVGASCYDYKKIPKTITTGYGLAEAPRGALGHWIKIEGRKVAKYQCVVPSTWNFSPRDNANVAGAVEQSLQTSWIGPDSDASQQILNILRIVHPFDCCIACAVHVVGPDGKEKLSFAIDPDGRPSNIKIADK
jgi:Ni,Fe-hydrogenase I large subunit